MWRYLSSRTTVEALMRQETIDAVIRGLKSAGVRFVCNVPDSWLAPLIAAIERDREFTTITATNEGEGVALCAGVWLGGKRAVMLMENSGVRMACEELARLGLGQGVPILMILPYRGDLGDDFHWAQAHGWTMRPILDALRADYRVLDTGDDLASAIVDAQATMSASRNHVALILSKRLCTPPRSGSS
jgi:sulfopyruvate decarboxylase subunit alpha